MTASLRRAQAVELEKKRKLADVEEGGNVEENRDDDDQGINSSEHGSRDGSSGLGDDSSVSKDGYRVGGS